MVKLQRTLCRNLGLNFGWGVSVQLQKQYVPTNTTGIDIGLTDIYICTNRYNQYRYCTDNYGLDLFIFGFVLFQIQIYLEFSIIILSSNNFEFESFQIQLFGDHTIQDLCSRLSVWYDDCDFLSRDVKQVNLNSFELILTGLGLNGLSQKVMI